MKNTIHTLISIAIVVGFSACSATYNTGVAKTSYTPKAIDNAKLENGALIKVADGLYINKVDNKSTVFFLASSFSTMLGFDSLDSVIVTEGKHSIQFQRDGKTGYRNLFIGSMHYKKGHEYFINYTEFDSRQIYYWMEDLTDNKVVYGKKVTEESLKNKKD